MIKQERNTKNQTQIGAWTISMIKAGNKNKSIRTFVCDFSIESRNELCHLEILYQYSALKAESMSWYCR